jgi:hypothetical protein
MVFGVFMANHLLDAFGLIYLLSVAIKLSRGYGILRSFW